MSCNNHEKNGKGSDPGDQDDNSPKYVYRDFASILPDPIISSNSYMSQSEKDSDAKKLPNKLNVMLSDPDLSGIIEWLPHGRSWLILDRKLFAKKALQKYYNHTNIESFLRLVNAWGFRRCTTGIDQGSYYHELFLRGKPHLHARMKRFITNEKKAPVEADNIYPNFYEMPLPDPDSKSCSSAVAGGAALRWHSHPTSRNQSKQMSSIESLDGSTPPASSSSTGDSKSRDGSEKANAKKPAYESEKNDAVTQKSDQASCVASSPSLQAAPAPTMQSETMSCVTHNMADSSSAIREMHANQSSRTPQYNNPTNLQPHSNINFPMVQSPPTMQLSSLLDAMTQQQSGQGNPPTFTNLTQGENHPANRLARMPFMFGMQSSQLYSSLRSSIYEPIDSIENSVVGMTAELLNTPVQTNSPPQQTNQIQAQAQLPNESPPQGVLLVDIITNLLLPVQGGSQQQTGEEDGSRAEAAYSLLRAAEERQREARS